MHCIFCSHIVRTCKWQLVSTLIQCCHVVHILYRWCCCSKPIECISHDQPTEGEFLRDKCIFANSTHTKNFNDLFNLYWREMSQPFGNDWQKVNVFYPLILYYYFIRNLGTVKQLSRGVFATLNTWSMVSEPTRETFDTMDLSTVRERGHFLKFRKTVNHLWLPSMRWKTVETTDRSTVC